MDVTRRGFLASLLAVPAVLADDAAKAKEDWITPAAQDAIDRGLKYLAGSQAKDGSYGDRGHYLGNVAITALAGMAFMAGGSQPDRGPYGKQVTRCIEYILSTESTETPGFLYRPVGASHGPMYSHGFGTLMLAEVHGMILDPALAKKVRATLERAVALILNAQNHEGGWRYRPIKEQADISVTICQMMALRSARNAGLHVPKSAADRCIEYVKACQNAPDGGFRYLKQGGQSGFARSAAGICALYCAGLYEGKEIERGLRYLQQFKPGGAPQQPLRRSENDIHYYYGHYYAAQAIWTAGEPHWSNWFPAVRDDLVARSKSRGDGAWPDPNFTADYGTAMACIILQIPNNYLPILQK